MKRPTASHCRSPAVVRSLVSVALQASGLACQALDTWLPSQRSTTVSVAEAASLHNCHEYSGLGSSHNPGVTRHWELNTCGSRHSSRPLEDDLDTVNVTLGLLRWLRDSTSSQPQPGGPWMSGNLERALRALKELCPIVERLEQTVFPGS